MQVADHLHISFAKGNFMVEQKQKPPRIVILTYMGMVGLILHASLNELFIRRDNAGCIDCFTRTI